MRYLGNKASIIEHIISQLQKHNLLDSVYTFFDACCGSGAVANAVKEHFNIILNDNLLMATTFSKGRIVKSNCDFKNLPINPFTFFNSNREIMEGFFIETMLQQNLEECTFQILMQQE